MATRHQWMDISTLFLRRFVGVLPVVLTVSHTQGGIATISGPSMQPTLNPADGGGWTNDRVLVDRLSVHKARWKQGDVALISSPNARGKKLIKRIVGLEGDWIRSRSGELVVVPRGKCWVEGDNAANSLDSNDFGCVPLGLIDGIAHSIIWPPSRRGKIDEIPVAKNERVLFVSAAEGGGKFTKDLTESLPASTR